MPFVLALRTDGKSLSSIGDDRLGGYLATWHLLDLGHRRIGIIAGPGYASSARGRQEGYRQALGEQDIVADPDLIVDSTFSIDAGTDAALTLMRLFSPPTAIFAVYDNTAIGAMSALINLGLRAQPKIELSDFSQL